MCEVREVVVPVAVFDASQLYVYVCLRPITVGRHLRVFLAVQARPAQNSNKEANVQTTIATAHTLTHTCMHLRGYNEACRVLL